MDIKLSNFAFSSLIDLCDGKELSPSDLPEDVFKSLESHGFIRLHTIGYTEASDDLLGSMPVYRLEITEAGKAYVESVNAEQAKVDQWQSYQDKTLELFQKKLVLYEKELEDAKIDTRKSAIRSWIAIFISIGAIVATIVTSLPT